MDIRRAEQEEIGEIDALLESRGQKPLPRGVALSNVLVGLDDGVVTGVAALDFAARRGLVLCAAVAADVPPDRVAPIATSLLRSLISRAQELGLRDLYTLGSPGADAFALLGFAPVAHAEVPSEVRGLRDYPRSADASTPLLHLSLETRI